MGLSFPAYVCFMNFIQREGSRAVRLQTELAIAPGIQKTLVPVIDSRGQCRALWILDSQRRAGRRLSRRRTPLRRLGLRLCCRCLGPRPSRRNSHGHDQDCRAHAVGRLSTPTAVFERLNEVLPTVKEPQMYATCTALRIQPVTNDSGCRVDDAIAGQPAMLLVSGNGSATAWLTSSCRWGCSQARLIAASASSYVQVMFSSQPPTGSWKLRVRPGRNSASQVEEVPPGR
jgi:hypothetical protein